nr:hypothetical protein [Tanacetum cinerariifolium]
MTSITAQQTKLDLELVPKENRLDIGKCNGRIPRGLKPKEETFQNSVYKHHGFYRFKINKKKRFKLTLEVFRDILQIFPRTKDQDFDALPSKEDTVSFLRKLGYTGVINSLNDVVIDRIHQPWRTFAALINRSLSGKTTALDKLCIVPPKVTTKFKKASPSKKDSVPIPADEEPVQKGKRVKRSAKKSSTTPTIALTKEAQMKEVRKKSLRDFHKSHPSGSASVAEKPSSVEKITPPVTSEGTGDKPGVPDVTKDESTESESESWGNNKDDSNNEEGSEQENDSEEYESDSEQDTNGSESDSESDQQDDDDDDDDNDDDKSEGDEDRGMDSDDGQDKNVDVGMTDAQQGKENLEITQEQVVEDAHVTITKKTKVHVTSSSRSSDLASKFLNFLDIPPADTEIVSPLDYHVHHKVPRIYTSTLLAIPVSSTPSPLPTTKTTNIPSLIPDFASVFRFNNRIIALEKDVVELKNDPLHTQVTAITKQVRNQLPQILLEEVSNFAPPMIEKIIQESLNQVNLEKASSQPQSSYEAAATLIKFELKKILIDKINSSESYLTAPEHRKCYDDEGPSAGLDRGLKKRKTSKDAEPTTSSKTKDSSSNSSKGTKSQPKSSRKSVHVEEPEFEVGDTDTSQGQEGNQGPAFRLLKGTRSNYAELEYDFEECYKALSKKLDWKNPEGGDYPFDLSKPLPLIMRGNRQSVPVEFFINNDLKYLQGGISTMTYTTSTTKTKAAQYDLPCIEDMVPNIWNPVKVAYDKYALWVTHVSVMRKHGYGYLEEIVVRRADNALYKFKEGDDVVDFAIALRMFTRSLVIQKRVKVLQLGVKSYQKHINVTKPDTARLDLRKRHPDGTLTRLLSSLEDITKNIDMEYLPKRIWSTLKKKRAHCMIKDINKLLKERRMKRSFEKFVGGRLYGNDLRLLQRKI